MRKNTKRSAVIIGVATAVAGAGVAAWAAGWGVEGKGSANAEASTVKEMSATTELATTIYPGAKVQATTTVKNDNDFRVQLNGPLKAKNVELVGKGNGGGAACVSAINTGLGQGLEFAAFPSNKIVDKGNTSVSTTLQIPMELPQDCAGNKLKINYTFSGISAADA